MGHSFLIVGMGDIHVDPSGGFVGLSFVSEADESVRMGLHPDMANDLAMSLLKSLHDATNRGILPQSVEPIGQGKILTEPAPVGVNLTFDLPNQGPRIQTVVSWEEARILAERLLVLCDQSAQHQANLN